MMYREFRFWSPFLGCEAARISVADERGQEYFAIVPCGGSKAYRAVKERALDALDEAIAAGRQPGEVKT